MPDNFDASIFDTVSVDNLEDVEATVVESPVTSEVTTDSVVAPIEPTETAVDDSTPLTPREKVLMERLEKLTGERLDLTTKSAAPEPTAFVPSEKNFLEGIADLDEVFSSSDNINKLLLAVHNSALEEASKLTAERILSNLPQIMSQYVAQHIGMDKLVEDFYIANPDLREVKRTVAAVANEISAEHPEFTTEQVFAESALKTREVLRLKQFVPEVKKPAFATTGNSRNRVRTPTLQGIEKDVMDLIS